MSAIEEFDAIRKELAAGMPEGTITDPNTTRPPLKAVIAGTIPDRPRPGVLIDGLLDEGDMVALGAGRSVGKSWWGMGLAKMLAEGHGRFMGTLTVRRPVRVLYCHGELHDWAANDRWEKLAGHQGPVNPNLIEMYDRWRIRIVRRRIQTSPHIMDDMVEAVLDDRLADFIRQNGIDVLIIDPWAAYYTGKENSNDEVEAALDKLKELQEETGVAIIILHHFGKNNDTRDPEDLWRGASRLADMVPTRVTVIPFYSHDQARKQNLTRHQARRYARVTFLRRTYAPTEDFSIKWNVETGQWERWNSPEDDSEAATGFTAADIAAKCPPEGWPSIAEAGVALGIHKVKAAELLLQAKHAGLLEQYKAPGARGGAQGYRVRQPDPGPPAPPEQSEMEV